MSTNTTTPPKSFELRMLAARSDANDLGRLALEVLFDSDRDPAEFFQDLFELGFELGFIAGHDDGHDCEAGEFDPPQPEVGMPGYL